MIRVFLNDDPGYLDWLAAYPDGFVLNMLRNPTPDYLVLHRPECESISLYTQWRFPGGFTERQYRKVCGETRAALAGWVAQQGWPGAAWSEGCYCHSARQAPQGPPTETREHLLGDELARVRAHLDQATLTHAKEVEQLQRAQQTLRLDLARVTAERDRLTRELAQTQTTRRRTPPEAHAFLVGELTRLITICHPDHWGGENVVALELTKHLLALRDQLKDAGGDAPPPRR